MRETKLYEELLKLKGNIIKIELSGSTNGNATPIIAISGARRKSVLKKIIEVVEKNKAELELLPHGIIQIYFKETNE